LTLTVYTEVVFHTERNGTLRQYY